MSTLLADSLTDPIDRLNRIKRRDTGQTGWGEPIVWRPNSASTGLDIDNAGGGNHANFGSGDLIVGPSSVDVSVQLLVAGGTVGAPGVAFRSDTSTDTGLYRTAENGGGFSAGGVKAGEWLNTGGVVQLLGPAGTVALPGLSLFDDPDNGIYRIGANDTAYSAGGTIVTEWKKTGSDVQILVADGVSGVPGLGFIGGTTSGFRRNGTDRFMAVAGATDLVQFAFASGQAAMQVGVSFASDWPARVVNTSSASGSKGLNVNVAGTAAADSAFLVEVGATAPALAVQMGGAVQIGTVTPNTLNTKGLTINQAGADDEVLSLKSSDVAHGMTDWTETDTFCNLAKINATQGGVFFYGLTTSVLAIYLAAHATTNNTTVSTAATGNFYLSARKKSGTTVTTNDANANLLVIADFTTARFLVDAEGDVKYDGATGAGAWDDEPEDVALLEAFRLTTMQEAPKSFRRLFSDDIRRHAQRLHETGVITLSDNGDCFISTKGLNGLLIDSVRQVYGRLLETRDEVAELRGRLLALEGAA